MGKQSRRKKTQSLEDVLYITPRWLTDRKKYRLASMDESEMAKLKTATEDAIELNRKRYENAASTYTRVMLDIRKLYGEKHEVTRALGKNAPGRPPDLVKLWNSMKVKWAEERRAEAKRLRENDLARERRARKKAEQEEARKPKLLPEYSESTKREIHRAALRASWHYALPDKLMSSPMPIMIPPRPGQPVVNLKTNQFEMFAMSDMSGVYG